MITAHTPCVRRRDWALQTRNGIAYCTCGVPVTDETREYAETLHRLLFPALYNDAGSQPAAMEATS